MIYVVKQGDTLFSISAQTGVPVWKMVYDNQLASQDQLVIGQALLILDVYKRQAHTLKGVAGNMGLTPLFDKVCAIVEPLRVCKEEAAYACLLYTSGLPRISVSVNVSRADIYNADLSEILRETVKKYHLPASRLHLEITESAYTCLLYTSPAGGRVLLRTTETEAGGQEASFTFRVIDNGKGIRPEDQKRIFKSFEQLGSNISRSQGTGLGLAISSNIVRMMGGELRVKSCLLYTS